MALDAADWTVSITGDIRWTGAGTATNVTVLEMHRFLQDLADDAVATASTGDYVDISDETPSDRATDNIITLINGYNIDDTAAEHIFDGSITQDGGDTVYSGLVVVGAVVAGTQLQIVQDNALLTSYWGTGLNEDAAANILLRIMVKTRADGADIDGQRIRVTARELGDTYAEFSATLGVGNSTAAIFTGTDLNNATAAGTIATYDQFNNTEGYQQIDVTGDGTDEDYYSQWDIGGGTTPASPTINDLYEYTKYIQRRGTAETIHGMNGDLFRGITAQWAYDAEGGGGPATNDEFCWGTFLDVGTITGTYTVGEKVTGTNSGAYGRLLSVDAANTSLVVSTESGTWQSGEVVTGFTSTATSTTTAGPVGQATGGGEATILAVDDDGTTGIVWVQLLKGSNPVNDVVCYESTAHTSVLTVNGAIQSRTLSPAFLGASTGTSIIGAFGIGIATNDLTASDQLFDLANTLRQPPNNVTFTVSGLVSGEDRVLVGPESGGVLQVGQFTIATAALTTANITSVEINTTVPSDTPSSGTIRVFDNDGVARRLVYTSYTGSTFTIDPTASEAAVPNVADFDVTNASIGNNVFISYIDELAAGTSASFTSVYSSDRALFIRVRDGGGTPIKTFETTGTLGSAGGSSTAIRTTDA